MGSSACTSTPRWLGVMNAVEVASLCRTEGPRPSPPLRDHGLQLLSAKGHGGTAQLVWNIPGHLKADFLNDL